MDQLAPVLDETQRLDRQRKALVADLHKVCLSARGLPGDEIAEVYWLEDSVPVALLGDKQEVLRAAREHPYWSWRCTDCSAEVFIKSRYDKRRRESPGQQRYVDWRCEACQQSQDAHRDARWKAAAAAMRERERELRTMPYRLYLQTDEWQERRKAALRRSGYRCQVCNRDRRLHVHHRTYERRGVELARDLIALCDECHALYHGKGLLAAHQSDGNT